MRTKQKEKKLFRKRVHTQHNAHTCTRTRASKALRFHPTFQRISGVCCPIFGRSPSLVRSKNCFPTRAHHAHAKLSSNKPIVSGNENDEPNKDIETNHNSQLGCVSRASSQQTTQNKLLRLCLLMCARRYFLCCACAPATARFAYKLGIFGKQRKTSGTPPFLPPPLSIQSFVLSISFPPPDKCRCEDSGSDAPRFSRCR